MMLQEKLTPKEKECLYWAGQDKTMTETAQQLRVSPATIKTHRKFVLQKLRCRTIAGALMIALKEGIL